MNGGGNKEIYTQQSSNKNSPRGNNFGYYRSYATNSLGEPYQQNNRKPLVPNNRYSY